MSEKKLGEGEIVSKKMVESENFPPKKWKGDLSCSLFFLPPIFSPPSLLRATGRREGEGRREQEGSKCPEVWQGMVGEGSFFIFLSLLLKGGKMEEGLTVPNSLSLSLSHFASDTKSQREKKASK